MPTAKLSGLIRRVNRDAPEPHADADLLAQFVRSRDGAGGGFPDGQAAFAELVRRHGPRVFAVCRRVAGGHHLAEDAFQAVFVVLAAKAARVRGAALPGFLHAVAVHTALRARTMNDRRRRRETTVDRLPEPAAPAPEPADDAAAVVDEEIAALPDALRAAVVLCELDGLSRKDAAARLSVPEGTVSSRLAAARKRLAARLRARGVAPAAAGIAVAAVPAELHARAVSAALDSAPAAVAALSNGVLRVMLASKLKFVVPLAAVVLVGLVALAGSPAPPCPFPEAPAPRPLRADPPAPAGPGRILFTRDRLLVTADPDGKNERAVSKDRDTYDDWQGGARLSPDGKRIAASVRDPKPDDPKRPLFTLHVRGRDEKEPGTSLGVRCWACAWSPDGGRIAYTEYDFAADRPTDAHFTVDVRTKKTTPLKLPKGHGVIDWTWNGKQFLTLGTPEKLRAKPDRLYLVSAESGEEIELADGWPLLVQGGRVSPDGKWVLMNRILLPPEKGIEPPPGLEVVEVATKKATAVDGLELNALVKGFCWSPDGKRIAYLWVRHPNRDLTPENLETLETERILTVCDPDGKNAKAISTEKGALGSLLQVDGIDWR